jgi:hypothetical protein
MLNYSTSPIAALLNGPGNPPPVNAATPTVTDDVHVRDILSGMINMGVNDFSSDEAKAARAALANRVGDPMAIRLMTQAVNFNGRKDMVGAPTEHKINTFFSMGSNDPVVDSYIKRAGNVGQGAIAGYQNSPLVTNTNQKTDALFGAPSAAPSTSAPLSSLLKKKMGATSQ